jgi:hypothetical protein
VFGYYPPADSRFAETISFGVTDREEDGDTKIASASITIKAELTLPQFIQRGIDWIWSKIDKSLSSRSCLATGQRQPTLATGQRQPTLATGQRQPTLATGQRQPTLATSQRQPTLATSQRQPTLATGQRQPTLATGQRQPTLATSQRQPTLAIGQRQPTPQLVSWRNQTSAKPVSGNQHWQPVSGRGFWITTVAAAFGKVKRVRQLERAIVHRYRDKMVELNSVSRQQGRTITAGRCLVSLSEDGEFVRWIHDHTTARHQSFASASRLA